MTKMLRLIMPFWNQRSRQSPRRRYMLFLTVILLGSAVAAVPYAFLGGGSSILTSRHKTNHRPPYPVAKKVSAAPAVLQRRLEKLADLAPTNSAVLVRSVDNNWVAGVRGAKLYSQGSLRRIWLGTALLEAVDQGEISLNQRVPLLPDGAGKSGKTEKVETLLRLAIRDDDHRAQDEVLAGLMGPDSMTEWLRLHDFAEVAFGLSNEDGTRKRDGMQHKSLPLDGATPDGLAFAMSEILAGRVLKTQTTELLLELFERHDATNNSAGSETLCLLGGSPVTGPFNTSGGLALVRLRSGERYVVVVFTTDPKNAVAARDKLLKEAIDALKR